MTSNFYVLALIITVVSLMMAFNAADAIYADADAINYRNYMMGGGRNRYRPIARR